MTTVTANGIKLHFVEKGAGPPLILSHGFQNSGGFAFRPVIDRLSESFRVIAWDMRGHGDSDKPKGPYRIQDFADDLLAFIDALDLEKVDLLGHSMGGRTSTLFAIDHSDRLKRLMLVSSSAGAPSGAYRAHFEELHRFSREKGMEALFEHPEFRRLIPENMLTGEIGAEYRGRFLKNTPQTYSDTANALFTMPDLRDRLGQIKVPTWVCYGENDPGPLDFSDVYLEKIPDCTRTILPGSGHFPLWDATEPFLEAMKGFLVSHPA